MTNNSDVSLNNVNGLMLHQKTSQCCRCWCCQPNIDWLIYDHVPNWGEDMQLPTKMFVKEEATFCGRTWSNCYPACRQTKYTVYDGEDESKPVIFTHEKKTTCSHCPLVMYTDNGPVRIPMCCCLPYLETKDAGGELLGTSRYVCDKCLCVPKYDLFDKNGTHVYRVRPDTCLGGVCVRCRFGGGRKGKCFRIPFPIRQPSEPYNQIGDAAISDLWAGMKAEFCTNREMYEIKFPGDATDAIKKTIIGMALLVDITLNEQDQ